MGAATWGSCRMPGVGRRNDFGGNICAGTGFATSLEVSDSLSDPLETSCADLGESNLTRGDEAGLVPGEVSGVEPDEAIRSGESEGDRFVEGEPAEVVQRSATCERRPM